MTASTYGNIGSAFLLGGAVLCLISIAFFFAASNGISLDDLNRTDLHDTYYIVLEWKHRVVLLLPFLASLILIASGFLIRGQSKAAAVELQEIEKMDF